MSKRFVVIAAVAALTLVAGALAESRVSFPCNTNCGYEKCGGPVNISGATLFRAFFVAPQSTFDHIDPDCDGTERIHDQLATDWYVGWGSDGTSFQQDWWLVQYRGVGSGNGLKEFVNSQCFGDVPTNRPTDDGYINRHQYYNGESGTVDQLGGCDEGDWADKGACCVTGAVLCVRVTAAECTSLGGDYQGDGTNCLPSVCFGDDPVGACWTGPAIGQGDCSLETAQDCADAGGVYDGDWTNCGACYSGTPVVPERIDMGVMDVPTTWFVTKSGATPTWRTNPGEPGYGLNPITSWDQGQSNTLKSLGCLNTDRQNPDSYTVFDTSVAFVPISFIANRGIGLGTNDILGACCIDNVCSLLTEDECAAASGVFKGNGSRCEDFACPVPGPWPNLREGQIKITELQHLYLTGRMPNGENLAACTRDSGSGTRNGGMNCIDLDPSWGRGDNVGKKTKVSDTELLGPDFQPTNKGGSSRMEGTVQNYRLAIGYTGVIGGSRSNIDSRAGKYEILSVLFDHVGACLVSGDCVVTTPYQCDALGGVYQGDATRCIGGTAKYTRPDLNSVLFNSYGNPFAWQVGSPETFATLGDPMETDPGSVTYMENQTAAEYLRNIIESINDFPTPATPGEYLADNFVLTAGTDANASDENPGVFSFNDEYVFAVKSWIESHNTELNIDDFGYHPFGDLYYGASNMVPNRTAGATYEDGSPDGNYRDWTAKGGSYPFGGGDFLSERNRIAGDFNFDGMRNIDDIDAMMEAYPLATRAAWVTADAAQYGAEYGIVIPEVIGDFNGDGNFNAEDIRYFCDGLAITPGVDGVLDRWEAFKRVDEKWLAMGNDDNFFDTVAMGCYGDALVWTPGLTAADVAGGTAWPGAKPNGWDGVVDGTDRDYIAANFGDWTNVDEAVAIDLSCDLTGDLVVNDADLVQFNYALRAGQGAPFVAGDMDCSGSVNFDDIDAFVAALVGEAEYDALFPDCEYMNADINGDCNVNFDDIDFFVSCLVDGGCFE